MPPKLITALIVLVMIGLFVSPLNFSIFYILVRPLVQPYANQHLILFGQLPLTGIFSLVLIGYSGLICMTRRNYTILVPNVVPLYVLLLSSVMSFLNTSDYIVSMAHVLKIATAVFMYLLIYNGIQTNSDARKVLYSIVIATIIPMLIGYYQFFTLTGGTGVMGILNRVKGTLVMANEYGIFLSIGLCAALMLLLQENGRFRRVFLICSAVSIAISSILALNRGTWIALTASFLFAYPFYRTKVKAKWFFIVGLIMAIFFSGIILERFMQLGETMPWGGTQNTFSRRIDMWKTISSLLHVHPVAGFGIGTSNLVTSKFFRIDNVPHNDYLRLLLEIGIPGVLLYILFLAKELYRNIRLPFDKKYWVINFPTLVMVTYWIIMSSVQNIIYDVINFPLFLTLLAVSRRWNEMSFSEENKL